MSTKEDYYNILGVSKSATPDELKKAYRKKAMQYHPDKNAGDKASEEKFKEVNEAYEVLNDPQKKHMYDQMGHRAFEHGHGQGAGGFSGGFSAEDIFGSGGFEDIFSSFFGGGGQRSRSSRRKKGDSFEVNISITLKEAFTGVKKSINIIRDEECSSCKGLGAASASDVSKCSQCAGNGEVIVQQGPFGMRQTCPSCRGNGTTIKNPCRSCRGHGIYSAKKEISINIQAGIESGTRLTLRGEGSSVKDGDKGSLYVNVSILRDKVFQRDRSSLMRNGSTSFKNMVLGGVVSIVNLDGSTVEIKIPEGTQNGQTFKVRGQGMPILDIKTRSNTIRGDLFVTVFTEIPKRISSSARKLLEELDSLV